MINDFFNLCVYVLEVIGNVTGMGYELANIVIFVFIQPLLILIFFILWRREAKKNKPSKTF
jgi:preprotein translocase subunit YajC